MLVVLACCLGVFGDPQGQPVPLVLRDVVVAAHEKTGTEVSGQLVQALRPFVCATHNFYWDPRGDQARRAIEFVRNPFAMLMSAYLYHARCSEALFNHAQRSRQPSQKRMHPQLARRKLLLGGGADGYVEKLDANEACH